MKGTKTRYGNARANTCAQHTITTSRSYDLDQKKKKKEANTWVNCTRVGFHSLSNIAEILIGI